MITYYSKIIQTENKLCSFYFPSLGENKSTNDLVIIPGGKKKVTLMNAIKQI